MKTKTTTRRQQYASQAILTQYRPATEHRSSGIHASAERGAIRIPYNHDLTELGNHLAAAEALKARFLAEDRKKYGPHRNPWSQPTIAGYLPNGSVAHTKPDTNPKMRNRE